MNSTDTIVYRWWVPLTYTTDFSQPPKSVWISDKEDDMQLPDLGVTDDEWVLFNVGQVGMN